MKKLFQRFTSNDANLREDLDWQDHHAGGGAERLHREREGQDPGQGGHPTRPAEVNIGALLLTSSPPSQSLSRTSDTHEPDILHMELSIHNENHAKKISFPCIKCDLNFDSSDHLREHRITTHDKDIRKNPPRRRTVNTRKINKTCYFWNTGFCKYADLDCKFLHESSTDECRYGQGCNNYQCPFFHVVTSKRKKRGMLYKHYQN